MFSHKYKFFFYQNEKLIMIKKWKIFENITIRYQSSFYTQEIKVN